MLTSKDWNSLIRVIDGTASGEFRTARSRTIIFGTGGHAAEGTSVFPSISTHHRFCLLFFGGAWKGGNTADTVL
jgi:hypothetical protein